MKNLLIIFAIFSFLTSYSQAENTADYENIQGKWICTTPKYKKHTFWVKKLSFFQKNGDIFLEQGLPYQINEPNNDEQIEIVGLFVKCDGCYEDLWGIAKLTSTDLVLVDSKTEEIVTYKKVLNVKKKKK